MKLSGMIMLVSFVALVTCGCQATMYMHLIKEVPHGTYTVTLVEADYGCPNSFGKNCIALFDIPDGRDLRLVYSGPGKEMNHVPADSVDGKGLIFYSITDEKGNKLGYLGFSEGRRAVYAAVFDNGSVVVGNEKIIRFGPLRSKLQDD